MNERYEALANGVKYARDLWELRYALIVAEEEYGCQYEFEENPWPFSFEVFLEKIGVDLCELPVFGKDKDWQSPVGTWSWDDDSMLVGEGPVKDWRIIDR